jgi:dihydroorotate dehydrogenase
MTDPHRLAAALIRLLPPETAHRVTIRALAAGLVPSLAGESDPALQLQLWGRQFPNPIGLAAGFDKDAEAFSACLRLGFGFVEVGSVTPRPQPGRGLDFAARALARRRPGSGIVGVNLGKNRDSPEATADYAMGARRLAALADYLVINVSSPNTPGLRALQGRAPLSRLIGAVAAARTEAAPMAPPPLLLKIAPDLTEEDRRDIAEVALEGGLDGLIVSNTTIARPPSLRSGYAHEAGGLSGRPLFEPSTAVLADMYRLTGGRLPLIGVGGIASGADAYAKIRAGASLVQLYSALVYEGPGLIRRIQNELAALLRADGFATLAEAVGADHRRP